MLGEYISTIIMLGSSIAFGIVLADGFRYVLIAVFSG